MGQASSSAELPPIKIGALLPLTGADPYSGGLLTKGVEFKLDEVNREVAGRKIKLIKEDDGCAPIIATDKVRKLAEADKVDVVFGPLFSHAAIPMADYLGKVGIPNLGFIDHSMDVPKLGRGFVFLHYGTLRGATYHLGRYCRKELGYRTVTTVYCDYVAGEEFTRPLLLEGN